MKNKPELPLEYAQLLSIAAAGGPLVAKEKRSGYRSTLHKCMFCRRYIVGKWRVHVRAHYDECEEKLKAIGALFSMRGLSFHNHPDVPLIVEQVFGFVPNTSRATLFWQTHKDQPGLFSAT